MTIWTANDLWLLCVRFERAENDFETCVVKLSLKSFECHFLSLSFAGCEILEMPLQMRNIEANLLELEGAQLEELRNHDFDEPH